MPTARRRPSRCWRSSSSQRDCSLFKKIKQVVSYATEVTAFVEKGKLKKITGVKTKELLLWLTVVEVYIADPSGGTITFKTGTGLSDSFAVSLSRVSLLLSVKAP